MNNNIGKLISILRKEKGLTQEQLGNLLNVGAKTISKWECGVNLPDTSCLQDISKIFNITVDELLNGKVNTTKTNEKKSKKRILPIIIIVFLIIIITLLILKKQDKVLKDTCTLIKTYHIESINQSNDENYLYTTINEFQTEGTYTIKLPIIESKHLKEDKNYVFTFNINKEYLNEPTDIILQKSNILKIEETDKLGLDAPNKIICD